MAGWQTLLAGFRTPEASPLVQLLQDQGHRVRQAPLTSAAHPLLMEHPFDLVVLGIDTVVGVTTARDLVTALRAFACPSRNAGCVVLAGDGALGRAHDLAGCGANRVYPMTIERSDLAAAVAQLLASGTNLTQRFSCGFRMTVAVDGRWVDGTALDISAGGFLLSSALRPQRHQRFQFRLYLPGESAAIEGEAIAVRDAAPGAVRPGTGARICSFAADGRVRFAAVLARLRRQRAEHRSDPPSVLGS